MSKMEYTKNEPSNSVSTTIEDLLRIKSTIFAIECSQDCISELLANTANDGYLYLKVGEYDLTVRIVELKGFDLSTHKNMNCTSAYLNDKHQIYLSDTVQGVLIVYLFTSDYKGRGCLNRILVMRDHAKGDHLKAFNETLCLPVFASIVNIKYNGVFMVHDNIRLMACGDVGAKYLVSVESARNYLLWDQLYMTIHDFSTERPLYASNMRTYVINRLLIRILSSLTIRTQHLEISEGCSCTMSDRPYLDRDSPDDVSIDFRDCGDLACRAWTLKCMVSDLLYGREHRYKDGNHIVSEKRNWSVGWKGQHLVIALWVQRVIKIMTYLQADPVYRQMVLDAAVGISVDLQRYLIIVMYSEYGADVTHEGRTHYQVFSGLNALLERTRNLVRMKPNRTVNAMMVDISKGETLARVVKFWNGFSLAAARFANKRHNIANVDLYEQSTVLLSIPFPSIYSSLSSVLAAHIIYLHSGRKCSSPLLEVKTPSECQFDTDYDVLLSHTNDHTYVYNIHTTQPVAPDAMQPFVKPIEDENIRSLSRLHKSELYRSIYASSLNQGLNGDNNMERIIVVMILTATPEGHYILIEDNDDDPDIPFWFIEKDTVDVRANVMDSLEWRIGTIAKKVTHVESVAERFMMLRNLSEGCGVLDSGPKGLFWAHIYSAYVPYIDARRNNSTLWKMSNILSARQEEQMDVLSGVYDLAKSLCLDEMTTNDDEVL